MFGEYSSDAVVREFDEESGVTFADPTPVGTFERVFSFDGDTCHEIRRVYEGSLVENRPYTVDETDADEREVARLIRKYTSAEQDDDLGELRESLDEYIHGDVVALDPEGVGITVTVERSSDAEESNVASPISSGR